MCVYTELALDRGFSHWGVVYPKPNDDTVLVGFSTSADTPVTEVFGEHYDATRSLGDMMPVVNFIPLCGLVEKWQEAQRATLPVP